MSRWLQDTQVSCTAQLFCLFIAISTICNNLNVIYQAHQLLCFPLTNPAKKLMKAIGHKRWAIPEGYIPGWSNGPEPEMRSHEALCFLNTSDQDAQVEITIFFSDREPAEPYRLTVPARRTKHVNLNELNDPASIPIATDYASLIESDIPIVVQYTRIDTRQAENALMSAIAYPILD